VPGMEPRPGTCPVGSTPCAGSGHVMPPVRTSAKAAAVNPLKMSQPLGASYAFLGMNRCMPVMHGSQGCTSFGLVLLVRHFREAIPLQTTAMNEATTIMGGYDNVEKAILNIRARAKPDLIAMVAYEAAASLDRLTLSSGDRTARTSTKLAVASENNLRAAYQSRSNSATPSKTLTGRAR